MTDGTWRPLAADGLELSELSDGFVLHQPAAERVHYLNHTAAVVFGLCTGRTPAAEMPELVRLAFGLAEPPAAEVATCLESLRAEGLIS
jgi:hypothetical protein